LADGTQEFVRILGTSHGLERSTWPVIPLYLRPVSPERIPESQGPSAGWTPRTRQTGALSSRGSARSSRGRARPQNLRRRALIPAWSGSMRERASSFSAGEADIAEAIGLLRQPDRFLLRLDRHTLMVHRGVVRPSESPFFTSCARRSDDTNGASLGATSYLN
jgi:hypothetical protein